MAHQRTSQQTDRYEHNSLPPFLPVLHATRLTAPTRYRHTTIDGSARSSVHSSRAAGSQAADSAPVSPRTEQWSGLSSEVEYLKQQLHAQVGELSWKMAQLQSQFDSHAATTATERLSQTAQTQRPHQPADTAGAATATSKLS